MKAWRPGGTEAGRLGRIKRLEGREARRLGCYRLEGQEARRLEDREGLKIRR
jgi:hypothetical protein